MVVAKHGLALVVRWNERTRSLIERYIAHLTEGGHTRPVNVDFRFANWDDALFALPVTVRTMHVMHDAASEFEAEGAIRGQDLAVLAADGSLDPLPDWLTQGLSPTGNPAELEAKMEADVYDMWQRTRLPMWELKPGA